jgi:hypothetical protein
VRLGWGWTPVTESPSGLAGRLRAWGEAPRRRGPGGDVGGARERPVEAGTGEALVVDEELGVDSYGFTVADGSKATPSLRRVLSARGRMPGVS